MTAWGHFSKVSTDEGGAVGLLCSPKAKIRAQGARNGGDKKVMTDKPVNGFEPEIIAFCCEH
jgi:hypothetical protein